MYKEALVALREDYGYCPENLLFTTMEYCFAVKPGGNAIYFGNPEYSALGSIKNISQFVTTWSGELNFVLQSTGTLLRVKNNEVEVIRDNICRIAETDIKNNLPCLDRDGKVWILYGEDLKQNKCIAENVGDITNVAYIRKDGTVRGFGPNHYGNITDLPKWSNVVQICDCSICNVGLLSNGRTTLSGSDYEEYDNVWDYRSVRKWSGIKKIWSSGGHIVGLKYDGTLVAAGTNKYGECNVRTAKDVVDVVVSNLQTIAITRNGNVLVYGLKDKDIAVAETWKGIVAVSSDGTNIIGLDDDGMLHYAGANSHNEALIDGVSLFDDGEASERFLQNELIKAQKQKRLWDRRRAAFGEQKEKSQGSNQVQNKKPIPEKEPQKYTEENDPQQHIEPERQGYSNRTAVILLSITAVLLLICVVIQFVKLIGLTTPAKSNQAQELVVFETDTADQQIEDDDYYLEKYSAPLQRYLSIVNGTATLEDFTNYDVDDYTSEEGQGVTNVALWENNFGYELRDVDGNGVKELLIALCPDSKSEFINQVIYDMYTLKEGVSARVFVSGERYRYYLMEDGRFYFQGSSGAADSTFCSYYYRNGELIYDQEMGVDLTELLIVTVDLIPITDESISYRTNNNPNTTGSYIAYVADIDLSVYGRMDAESPVIDYIQAGTEVSITECDEDWGWVEYTYPGEFPCTLKGYCRMAYITSEPGWDHEPLTEDTAWELMQAWDRTSGRIYDYIVSEFTEGVDYTYGYTFASGVGNVVTCIEMGDRENLEALLSGIYTPRMVYSFMEDPYSIDLYVGYAVHKGDWAELEDGTVFFIPNYGMGRSEPLHETLSIGTGWNGSHTVQCDFIYPGEDEPSYYISLELVYTEQGWRIQSETQQDYCY